MLILKCWSKDQQLGLQNPDNINEVDSIVLDTCLSKISYAINKNKKLTYIRFFYAYE